MEVGDLIVSVITSPTTLWWEKWRLLYNLGLVMAGVLAFACYVFVLIHFQDLILAPDRSQGDSFTLFTIGLQGVGYLFMMLVANLCYFLGPISEKLIRPRNVDAYRKIAFHLGFWGSVALPFSIPVLLTLLAIFDPSYWQTTSASR